MWFIFICITFFKFWYCFSKNIVFVEIRWNLVWRPRKVYFNGKRKFLFYFAFLTSYSHLSWFFKFKLMYRYTFVHCDKYWYSFKWLRMLRYMLKCHLSADDIKIYRLRLLSFGSDLKIDATFLVAKIRAFLDNMLIRSARNF